MLLDVVIEGPLPTELSHQSRIGYGCSVLGNEGEEFFSATVHPSRGKHNASSSSLSQPDQTLLKQTGSHQEIFILIPSEFAAKVAVTDCRAILGKERQHIFLIYIYRFVSIRNGLGDNGSGVRMNILKKLMRPVRGETAPYALFFESEGPCHFSKKIILPNPRRAARTGRP